MHSHDIDSCKMMILLYSNGVDNKVAVEDNKFRRIFIFLATTSAAFIIGLFYLIT